MEGYAGATGRSIPIGVWVHKHEAGRMEMLDTHLGEGEFLEEVLKAFATEASEWLGAIKTVLSRVESASTSADTPAGWAAVQRHLTNLKGSAGTVRLSSVEELAWRLAQLLEEARGGTAKPSPAQNLLIRQSLEVLDSVVHILLLADRKALAVIEVEAHARQQIERIKARAPEATEFKTPRRLPPSGPAVIELRNLRKIYGEGSIEVVAVNGVSLTIQPREMVAILGPSGSGKTTLLSMMGFLLAPTSGTIHLLGRPVDTQCETRLPALRRQHIGFIFQHANLLRALTAVENVLVTLRLKGITGSDARRRAEALLDRVGLQHRAHFLPRDLSGGEKQRVAVARALAGTPSLILADEPTANLDSKNGQAVVELIREIATEGRVAVAMVTHDTRNLRLVDRLVHLEDGRLVE
jgi:putative ABC transport system ATP-binding protein